MKKQEVIECLQTSLRYTLEDVGTALAYAKEIKDPELTKKLTEIKDKTQGVKDYIVSKADPKTFG